MDERLDGLGRTVQKAPTQVVCGTATRFERVLVGGQAVAREQVAPIEEVLGDIAVQVHGRTDHGIGADDAANGGHEVPLGIVHALDAHGTMDVEEEAVKGTCLPQPPKDLLLPGVVRAALDDAAGKGARVEDGDPLDLSSPVLVPPVEALHELASPGDDEVLGCRNIGGEG